MIIHWTRPRTAAKLGWLQLMLCIALTRVAVAASAMPAIDVFKGEDIFRLQVASDPQVNPDGTKVAYVRSSNDIMVDRMRSTIWLTDIKSGVQTPIAASNANCSEPRWSPDGERLAYVSSVDGSTQQIHVTWLATGATARISTLAATPKAISWSPDGTQIAFVMTVPEDAPVLGQAPRKPAGALWAPPLQIFTAVTYRRDGAGYKQPGYDHIFVVPSSGGAVRQVSSGSVDDAGPLSWSPDGRALFFSANRSPEWEREPLNTEVHRIDLATLRLDTLTRRDGPDSSPTASPDGRHVAYLGFDDKRMGYQNLQLYVADSGGANPHALTRQLDRGVRNPIWAGDGQSIYIQYDDHGSTRVARVGLDGGIRNVAAGLVGSDLDRPYGGGGSFSVARDGTVAYTAGTALRPSDVWIARKGETRQLTQLNDSWLQSKALGQVHSFAATAPDGRSVDAWMVTPPGFDSTRKYPLILEIHGGPFASYGPTFSIDNQLYAADGYIVVYSNPRGSTSYGEEFANLIHHAYPGEDYHDLMAVVDAAIARGIVDSRNLFITGGSGGGVLTAWTIGKTPRFAAAAVQKPVVNWSSFTLTTDLTKLVADNWFGKYPWEDPQSYWTRSPLSVVGNVTTPTLVLVGTDDYRTVPGEAEQYYAALQQRRVPTTLIKIPEASHDGVAARPSQLAAKGSAILAWFARYRRADTPH